MDNLNNANIDKIKSLAKEQGVKIKFICSKLGLAETYLSNVKNGKDRMTMERLEIIADTLNTTVEYLTDKTDQKEKPTPKEVDVDKLIETILNLPREKKEELFVKFMEIMKESE